jgi:hypothetical protein
MTSVCTECSDYVELTTLTRRETGRGHAVWLCRWCVLRERAGREVRPGAEVRVIDQLDFDEKFGCD